MFLFCAIRMIMMKNYYSIKLIVILNHWIIFLNSNLLSIFLTHKWKLYYLILVYIFFHLSYYYYNYNFSLDIWNLYKNVWICKVIKTRMHLYISSYLNKQVKKNKRKHFIVSCSSTGWFCLFWCVCWLQGRRERTTFH